MNWYFISFWNGQKKDWNRCGTELNTDQLLNEINSKKFVKFSDRVYYEKNNNRN